jgi:hypothetical protein
MMFVGGVFAARAYQEAIVCYLDACFIACVVLCQIVLEHSLAGVFQLSGEEGLDGAGFFRLLRQAERVGMFTKDEVRAFDEVRKLRNEYTHGKVGGMAWLLRRGSKHTSTFDALEEDATQALRALGRIIREEPVKRRRVGSRRAGRTRREVPTSRGPEPHQAELDRTRDPT